MNKKIKSVKVGITMNQEALYFSKCVFGTDNVVGLSTNISNQMNAAARFIFIQC